MSLLFKIVFWDLNVMKIVPMLFAATKNCVAVTDNEQHYVVVLDVKNRSFYEKFRGFEKIYDEERDGSDGLYT